MTYVKIITREGKILSVYHTDAIPRKGEIIIKGDEKYVIKEVQWHLHAAMSTSCIVFCEEAEPST